MHAGFDYRGFGREASIRHRMTTRPSHRRLPSALIRTFLAIGGVALVAAVFSTQAFGDAFSPGFGARYLDPPCCADPLNGTRAVIDVAIASADNTNCLLFRSEADTPSYLIQAGTLRCGPTSPGLDGSCSLSNNLVHYVETEVAGAYTCYPHGAASLNSYDIYTVDQAQPSSNQWTAFINGTLYEHNTFAPYRIMASAEHTSDSCSGWSGWGTWGENGVPWQRWIKSSLTWFTIQTSAISPGCWTLVGAPPSSFIIKR
jgi:hypothetical protein